MNYSENNKIYGRKIIKRKKHFVANAILFLIGICIGSVMFAGIIHIFCCTKAEAATIDVPETMIVEEPEIQQVSLGEYKLTAYCACFKCCGKHPSDVAYGITKSGVRAVEGVTVAADTRILPLGTEVIIDNHEYIVQDIGGAIKGNRIDVYFENHQDALEFGVQYKEIFLKEGEI